MKKAIVFFIIAAALAAGLIGVPSAKASVPQAPETSLMAQPLSCANGVDAEAIYNAHMRQYATSFSASIVVVPAGAIVKATAMNHTGEWLRICYAGAVGWSNRGLYQPASDIPIQTVPILPEAETVPPPDLGYRDSDLDGYPDNADFCPNTPAGYAPGSLAERPRPYTGCPHEGVRPDRDSDLDGYPDNADFCPYTPAGYLPGSLAERPRPYTGCPHTAARPPRDSDLDGYPDTQDYCPNTPAGYLPGSAAERPRPYTGCPHDPILDQCIAASPHGVCVNILAGGVTLETYGGYMVPATCLFADAATGGCWTPVVAKRAGNSQFVVRAYATASVGDVLAGYLIEGWAAMDLFGPVVGDLALVPSY